MYLFGQKILAIGDSITVDVSNTIVGGYRFYLGKPFSDWYGATVNWVGDNASVPGNNLYAGTRICGAGGQRIDDILNSYDPGGNVAKWQPDLCIIHLGTNDMLQYTTGTWAGDIPTSIANMSTLLTTLFANGSSSMKVCVCKIIPHGAAGDTDANITEWISQLVTMLASHPNADRIFTADCNSAFKANPSWATDYYNTAVDLTHPSDAGEVVMANAILSAIQSNLQLMDRTYTSNRFAIRGWGDKCLYFDGVNDFVDFGTTNFAFEYNQPFSVSTLIKPLDTTGSPTIFGRLNTSTTFRGWVLRYIPATRNIALILFNDNATNNLVHVRSAVESVPRNRTTRVGFSYSGTGVASGIIFYINGEPSSPVVIRDTLSGTIVSSGINARIGTITDTSLDGNFYMTDTAVYTRVLTPAENKDIHYNGNYPSSPYAIYKFNEGSGATLTDTSGNGRDGTITAAVWNTSQAPFQTSRQAALSRSAASARQSVY